jgi:hypothetical protein
MRFSCSQTSRHTTSRLPTLMHATNRTVGASDDPRKSREIRGRKSSPALARRARRAWAFLRIARVERNNEEDEQRWSPVVVSRVTSGTRG